MKLNLQVRLYPTKQMRTYLNSQCDYRRYCWNKALSVWNDIYDQRVITLPNELKCKIRESLTDKTITFTDDEMNQRKKNDLLHKFTTRLYQDYDVIVIEDLSVKKMQMSKKVKGLHRSLFGRFRLFMEYKAEKFEKRLVIADKYYPSTQRCSCCGYIKTGDDKITLAGNEKYGTKHHEYHCYECGYKADRDENAVLNLLALI